MAAVPVGPLAKPQQDSAHARAAAVFDFVTHESDWVDEFEHLAARRKSGGEDHNVVVVAKAAAAKDAAPDANGPENVAPKDVPKQPVAATDDDAQLTTGSLGSQRPPLLPPVPGPDAFKVEKGDRLGATQRLEPALAPGATPPMPDVAISPHADLSPAKVPAVQVPAVKTAMLLPPRADKLKTVTISALKPLLPAPARPDTLFQGPPMPADPTQDPDAPVLGYADQMSPGEAPFKALFAVTPADRHSWLGVDAMPPKAKATKPAKQARAAHHRTRRRDS